MRVLSFAKPWLLIVSLLLVSERVLGETAKQCLELAEECDCIERIVDSKVWRDELQYVTCVKKQLRNTDCDLDQTLEDAMCLPFPPTLAPTCEEVSYECDCWTASNGRPWRDDLAFAACVQQAVRRSRKYNCDVEQLILDSDCLPITPDDRNCGEIADANCDCSESARGIPWKEGEYEKCVARAAQKARRFCPLSVVTEETSCTCEAAATSKCPCDAGWNSESTYTRCVERALKGSQCNLQDTLDAVGCLPFPGLPTCEELANSCSCVGRTPNVAWKNDIQFVNCIKANINRAKKSCDLDAVLDTSDCLRITEDHRSCETIVLDGCACDMDNRPGTDRPWASRRQWENCAKGAIRKSKVYCNVEQTIIDVDDGPCMYYT